VLISGRGHAGQEGPTGGSRPRPWSAPAQNGVHGHVGAQKAKAMDNAQTQKVQEDAYVLEVTSGSSSSKGGIISNIK
jgi:hypothetical protein